MQLGMIGLGRMGGNMVERLMSARSHLRRLRPQCRTRSRVLRPKGRRAARTLKDFVKKLTKPRAVWIMVPAGEPTESTVNDLAALLDAGDILIDGGNSHFKDDARRAKALKAKGIHYLDVGTSGGIWGKDRGYCMMIGGDKATVKHLDPIFKSLAPGRRRYSTHCGSRENGRHRGGGLPVLRAGGVRAFRQDDPQWHRVRHHAGVRRGLRHHAQCADLEGTRRGAPLRRCHLADIAEVWRRGSVVSSWLLDLTAMALAEDPTLSNFTGDVQDSRRRTLDGASGG